MKLENLPLQADGSATKLTLYWNEATKEWGKPNADHWWIKDVEHDATTGQPTIPITPTADYNTRYNTFNKNDLCDSNFPVHSIFSVPILNSLF